MARPSVFSQELADAICEQLASGKSLRKICRRADMPDKSTVLRWLASYDHTAFRVQYALAREAQAEHYGDEIVDIADTPKMGVITITKAVTIGEVTAEQTTTRRLDMLGHRKLQIDSRKWVAARLHPKKWGDRLELGGEIGLKTVSAEPLQDDEWAAKHTPA